MRKYTFIIAAIAALTIGVTYAQDSRIKRVLDQSGLKYTTSSNGNFKMTFSLSEGRSQIVVINGEMHVFSNEPIVEIWTPVYKGKSIENETLAMLLITGFKKKIGGGEVTMEGDDIYGLYVVKIPLSAFTAKYAKDLCWSIAGTGDEVENKLMSGSDDF